MSAQKTNRTYKNRISRVIPMGQRLNRPMLLSLNPEAQDLSSRFSLYILMYQINSNSASAHETYWIYPESVGNAQ